MDSMKRHLVTTALLLAAFVALAALPQAPAVAQHNSAVAQSARQALRDGDWARAVELYESVLSDNPYVGAYWEAYGLSLHALRRYNEALVAFQHCIEIGFRPLESMYNIACGFAQRGQSDSAVDWLERAYAAGFINDQLVRGDSDLDPLRNQRRFRTLVGIPLDDVPPRGERWSRDLAYLERRLREVHWDLHGVLPAAEFARRFGALRKAVTRLDDNQMRYEIQKLLAAIGDGHTTVVPDRFMLMHGAGPGGAHDNVASLSFFPLALRDYATGVFVDATLPEHAAALGGRVVRLGSIGVDEALRRVGGLVSSDNSWGARWVAMDYLRTPGALQVLGIVESPESLRLEIETPDGRRESLTLSAVPLRESAGFQQAYASSDAFLPLYLRDRDKNYWLETVEALNLVWVQFNSVRDMHGESLSRFAQRVLDTLSTADAQHLVIDLRHNNGGNGHLTQPLLHAVIRSDSINRRGHLFVVVGRETFSAAMAFAAALEQHTNALFVGEPTGSRPNFVGESSLFALPYSDIWISCSSRYHQNSDTTDQRHWIGPDIPAALTPEDFRTHRDPAFEAIEKHIRSARREAQR